MSIETAMVFALGFLTAALLSLALLSAVWRRAVRLTTRRVRSTVPLSMAEIKAEKDQIRAEYAMAVRRAEIAVEAIQERANVQVTEIARRTETIRDLNAELDARAARIASLEATRESLEERLAASEAFGAEKVGELAEARRTIAERDGQILGLGAELEAKVAENDGQRVEIVALRTQVDNLSGQVRERTARLAEVQDELGAHRRSFVETQELLTSERQRLGDLQAALLKEGEGARRLQDEIAQLGRDLGERSRLLAAEKRRTGDLQGEVKTQAAQIATETRRADRLAAELTALKAAMAEARDLAAREQAARDAAERKAARIAAERDRLKEDIMQGKAESQAAMRDLQIAAETAKAERTVLEGSLAKAREDRSRIQREVASLTREAQAGVERDRDAALLRERIDQVALDVARVTALMEGPGSAIERLLDTAPGAGRTRAGDQPLAERLRAMLETTRRQAAE